MIYSEFHCKQSKLSLAVGAVGFYTVLTYFPMFELLK